MYKYDVVSGFSIPLVTYAHEKTVGGWLLVLDKCGILRSLKGMWYCMSTCHSSREEVDRKQWELYWVFMRYTPRVWVNYLVFLV